VLSISTDQTVLDSIKCGYAVDEYCLKISNSGMPGTKCVNRLWYIGDRLLIPRIGDIRENLFRLAHDTLGHFGADKSYAILCDAYYWPNMRCDWKKPIFLHVRIANVTNRESAETVITRINTDVMEAQDNLLQAKIF
jgi:hypothetical protein